MAPLEKSENRWKPHSETVPDAVNVDQTEAILLKLRGDLNKIAPQTFESISNQMIELALKLRQDTLPRLVLEIFARVCKTSPERLTALHRFHFSGAIATHL